MDRRATTSARADRQDAAARTEGATESKAAERDAFSFTLLVRHPDADFSGLSRCLAMKPHRTSSKGQAITTPTGRIVAGTYPDSRWMRVWRCKQRASVAGRLSKVLDQISRGGEALKQVRATGGDAQIILRTTGDRHLGDTFSVDVLQRLADLGLDLGLEVFPGAATE